MMFKCLHTCVEEQLHVLTRESNPLNVTDINILPVWIQIEIKIILSSGIQINSDNYVLICWSSNSDIINSRPLQLTKFSYCIINEFQQSYLSEVQKSQDRSLSMCFGRQY